MDTIYMQFDRINLLLVYISGYIWSTPFSTSSAYGSTLVMSNE